MNEVDELRAALFSLRVAVFTLGGDAAIAIECPHLVDAEFRRNHAENERYASKVLDDTQPLTYLARMPD